MKMSIVSGRGFKKRGSFVAAALPLIASALFVFFFSTAGSKASAEGCGEADGFSVLASPMAPWKARPFARHLRFGEAHRRRAFADRARWKRRGQVARPPGRAALFLVCRGGIARCGNVARQARARCVVQMRPRHARNRRARLRAAASEQRVERRVASARRLGSRHGKSLFGLA